MTNHPTPTGGAPRRSSGAPPQKRHTRELLLDATAQVLRDTGYAGTKLADIASRVGVKTPALYRHFSSREALVEEVMTVGHLRFIEQIGEALGAVPAGADPFDRIDAAIEAHIRTALSMSDYAAASNRNMSQMPSAIRERQMVMRREYGAVWRRTFAAAAQAGRLRPELDLRAVQGLVIGAMARSTEWWDPSRGDLDAFVREAQRLVRAGIRADTTPAPDVEVTDASLTTALLNVDEREAQSEAEAQTKAARTRRRIMDAAAEVLSRKGYAGARLYEVAAAAGLQTAAVYYHFESLDDLVEEVILEGTRRVHVEVQGSLAALPADALPMRRIEVAIEAHIRATVGQSAYTIAAVRNSGQLPGSMSEAVLAVETEYALLWSALFERARAEGQIGEAVHPFFARMLMLGGFNWAVEWWRPESVSLDTLVTTAKTLMLCGIARSSSAEPIEGESP